LNIKTSTITAISNMRLMRGMKIWPEWASDVWRTSKRGISPSWIAWRVSE